MYAAVDGQRWVMLPFVVMPTIAAAPFSRVGGRLLRQEVGDGGADSAAADVVVAGEGGGGPAFQVRGAHGVGLVGRDDGAAPALVALGLGGPQSVLGQLALEVTLEFAGGGEGLHHELHRGQQFSGARVAGGEVHRGERPVVDAQGETVAVEPWRCPAFLA
ncbi:hypothetical protein [Streptomyces afghaniensis]|uniref:hypothetical protein n=1 Tax=Streptomyces afghaniensis TaxID=66865 RepID=UPI0027813225|nr:hypothetical protein [Streptomyces afghaniensis]MDQ1014386.1 hypothetical protein [Streptomyces afghaniensis]